MNSFCFTIHLPRRRRRRNCRLRRPRTPRCSTRPPRRPAAAPVLQPPPPPPPPPPNVVPPPPHPPPPRNIGQIQPLQPPQPPRRRPRASSGRRTNITKKMKMTNGITFPAEPGDDRTCRVRGGGAGAGLVLTNVGSIFFAI